MEHNYIVGLNIGNHDSSAALLKDGELIYYAEQERFSRHKLSLQEAPVDALKYILDKNSITLKDVEAIAIGMDWAYRNKYYQVPKSEMKRWGNIDNEDRYLPKEVFGDYRPKIYRIKHHIAHAASAYRLCNFEKSAILVIDNRGEDASSSLGYVDNGKIKFFKQIDIKNSLGIFYNRACRFTGLYGKYREVGKFMGLAAYGKPNMKMPVEPSRDGKLFKGLLDLANVSVHDAIQLRTEQFSEYFKSNCFPYEEGNLEEIMGYANFAASVQKTLEDVILDFVKELKEKTVLNNLVMAGGVALNCSANGKIERSEIFENIFIPPFSSDAGTSVGAALEVNFMLHGKIQTTYVLNNASLGVSYSNLEVLKVLLKYKNLLDFRQLEYNELYPIIAKYLSNGKIIGWMQGKFEAGPRALGNRSILADPRTRKSLIQLNKIKQREMWRPIAPSILSNKYSEYFSGSSNNKYFMNIAAYVNKDKQHLIPAVVHVDETARPQTVSKEENTMFFKLIEAFYKETGIPLVCNTSFNQKNIPLVNTPENALECFLSCDIDILVINNFIIEKRKN